MERYQRHQELLRHHGISRALISYGIANQLTKGRIGVDRGFLTIMTRFDELSGKVPWSQLQHAGGPAAALAPAMAEDDDAIDVLLDLAESPARLDSVLSPANDPSWQTLPQFRGRRIPVVVAEVVSRRVREIDRLARSVSASLSVASSPGRTGHCSTVPVDDIPR